MRWKGRQTSSNVDDRRGGSSMGKRVGGGLGIVGVIIVIVLSLILGEDPVQLLQQVDPGQMTQQTAPQTTPQHEAGNDLGDFVGVVLKDTEDVWSKVFREQLNKTYIDPTLVLFTGSAKSGCGFASAATGPFYCPADQKVYIDLSFFKELKDRFGAPGDFAMAYVIAHEVGHHVQYLLGITRQVDAQRQQVSKEEYNQLSVRLELQADFLAGVWAHHAQEMKQILEEGDIEEALNAANAIGDDRLQKQSQGYVVPDSFTHGTSAQRMHWFKKGFESGRLEDGQTFQTENL